MSAHQSGSQIVIEVSDDGRGINTERWSIGWSPQG